MKLNQRQKDSLARRAADAGEKFAVGSWLIGVFQQSWTAMFVGAFFAAISVILTARVNK